MQSMSPIRIPELLAPAGTLDAFKSALAAGADALYCGLSSFNARRNADNLTLDDLECACDMAHIAGSRVYITTNILVRDDELPAALALVHDAWCAGADAFIVADWGLLRTIHELWPQIELHLSTQANVADPRGVHAAIEAGCTRVTLARELTIPEIRACCGLGADIEIFAHGALCVCYSGQCLLSSAQRGRSANRGLCRQPCRLPYELLDAQGESAAHVGGTRLLSPKDLRTLSDLPAFVRAGVGSLKIEGRMKAPDYVATVVGVYRHELDRLRDELAQTGDFDDDVPVPISPGADRALRRAFNRDFTDSYLQGRSDNDMMSYARGNNRGQLVGAVSFARGRDIRVRLSEPIEKDDLLEIRSPERFDDYVTALAPRDAQAGETLEVHLSRAMSVGCEVRVIRSERAMEQARAYVAREHPRKRQVDATVRAKLGDAFSVGFATIAGDCHPALPQEAIVAHAQGDLVEAARTRPVGAEDLREHVGRMGKSAFSVRAWNIEADEGIGLRFSEAHAVRDAALEKLQSKLLEPWKTRAAAMSEAPYSLASQTVASPLGAAQSPEICALVISPAQARAAREAGATRLYALAEDLVRGACSSACTSLAPDAGERDSWPCDVIPLLGEVGRASDLELADRALGLTRDRGVSWAAAGTVAGLSFIRDRGFSPELWDTCELHNVPSFAAFAHAGVQAFWLSPELEMLEIAQIAQHVRAPLGICVYGRARTMTCEHCVLQALGPCAKECARCSRRAYPLRLRDEFGRVSLVTSDALGRSRLWEERPLDSTPQLPEFLRMGISRFLVDARLLTSDGTRAAVERVCHALENAQAGRPVPRRGSQSTGGHLFARIG